MINCKGCIYIVDDDLYFAITLEKIIKDWLLKNKFSGFTTYVNPESFDKSTSGYHCFYFLDIKMPNQDGFSLANNIYKKDKGAKIIFVSSYEDFIYDSFDYHAIKFLLKEKCEEEINGFLKKLFDEYVIKYSFKYYDVNISIPLEKIIFINKHINSIEIITNNRIYIQNTTLKKVENKLNEIAPSVFVQINKSQIINLNNVKSLENDRILMINEDVLYISRNRLKQVKETYYHYLCTS